MARYLIVGCGCHGGRLAAELVRRRHVVRGTTRRPDRLPAISATGAEAVLADPDRIATLVPALDHAGVVILLLGSASGSGEKVRALHGSRLEMLLTKVLDTTVRGIVYETIGSVDATLLHDGGERVRRVCEGSRIGYAALATARDSPDWVTRAGDTAEAALTGRSAGRSRADR